MYQRHVSWTTIVINSCDFTIVEGKKNSDSSKNFFYLTLTKSYSNIIDHYLKISLMTMPSIPTVPSYQDYLKQHQKKNSSSTPNHVQGQQNHQRSSTVVRETAFARTFLLKSWCFFSLRKSRGGICIYIYIIKPLALF